MSDLVDRLQGLANAIACADWEWINEPGNSAEADVREAAQRIEALEAQRDSAVRGQEIANRDLGVFTKRIEQLEAQQRWIPVSERLPEPGQLVLVLDGTDYCVDGIVEKPAQWFYFSHEPTYWMALPEPPEGE